MNHFQPFVDFGWGLRGLQLLLPTSDAIVIVDVLSFSTAVDVATSRGARVLPFPYGRADAESYAGSRGAILAQPRMAGGEQLSLSPGTLKTVAHGTRIVLPSPNGSRLSRETGAAPTLTGCLRNAAAVARAASSLGSSIGVIAAGERWPDGSLRPAIEDLLGAGSIIECMSARLSPDAEAARSAYRANYLSALKALSQSGRPQPLIRMLDYAQRWTATIDWRSLDETTRELGDCNAFLDAIVADEEGKRLLLPASNID